MKVSLNTVKMLTKVDLSVDELVQKINQQLGAVEQVIDLGSCYKDAVVVRVAECDKHPNADRLHVTKVDDGGVVEGAERDDNGLVQVVCGAPNVRADMFAVWLPPKSTVPSTATDEQPFVLDARELRGVISQGMLAAADELGIGSDHSGIVELHEADVSPMQSGSLAPGAKFAELFGLDDTIIDIENKMFTHRPDLFGQIGVAREIAGIQGNAFTSPSWYKDTPQFNDAEGLELHIANDAVDVVSRFMAVAIKGVDIKPSPLWLQCALVAMGGKPINNVVDVTNYVMLMTAQPTHAYDYDKLRGHKLGARMAQKGEKVELLNDKTYELDETDIVIVDGEGAVGLGGIMGGGNSEVSSDTTNVVLEVANFDMYAVRRSSMRHGLFTDALTRFNKGQSAQQNPHVMALLMTWLQDTAGGEQASRVFDEKSELYEQHAVQASSGFINARLGLELDEKTIETLLSNVEFDVAQSGGVSQFTAPLWRTDIELPEDIVEEVGRLYGLDNIPRELPQRAMMPAARNPLFVAQQRVRDSLSRAGANEVLSYSFVHEKVLSKAQQDITQAFRVSNALSPDLQYYRLSVLPSLLDKVHANIKAGHDEFMLFEIGKGHNKKFHGDDDEGLPSELEFVDAVYASKKPREGAAYYRIRRILDQLANDLGVELVYKAIDEGMDYPVTAPFDQSRSALVETRDGTFVGMAGELETAVQKNFKLPQYCAAMTLDMQGLKTAAEGVTSAYRALSRFPSVTQDITLKLPMKISMRELEEVVGAALDDMRQNQLDLEAKPLGVYMPESGDEKSISLRVKATHHEQTLTDSMVNSYLESVAGACAQKLGAVRV